ncbi:hypothetical protein SPRG_03223 [Saprolegnia parasitica CBS 223.65]|uniref:Cytochrome P450 n=1 Tax=Saprolegnia parasitica (strain CBS 223.65) TaxID=695850 RepID=A0A067CZP9_SAPPC|nr:hypothetical protein SPRG_03223 [Saprolegnia parasitica CBS 223.65]KDO32006.1 hypothetical protein SPRG_03223 [Saprolegnia parasitica CBS 223.65]|eukprot:XP_012197200.1 hypothetical protein SPRG_03223 [Saprolegnia parasitica CBS 223.65]
MLADAAWILLTLLLAVVVPICIAYVVLCPSDHGFSYARLPGPPPSHWLLGNARDIFQARWNEGSFPEPGLSWLKQYGSAYHVRILYIHRIALADPVALKHVLVTKAKDFPRNNLSRAFITKLVQGVGLLSAEGDDHMAMRRMMNPHFSHSNLKSFVPLFAAHTRRLLSQWRTDKLVDTNAPVNLYAYFTKLTLDIIGISAFGYDFGAITGTDEAESNAYNDAKLPATLFSILGTAYVPGWRYLPLPGFARRRAARDTLMAVVLRVIEAKMAAPAVDPPRDLLDRMLAAGPDMSATEARAHVFTFMQAGHETTSNTLCWVVALLSQHPAIEAAVRAECQAALQQCPDGSFTADGLAHIPLLTAVIQETLRYYPTVINLAARGVTKDEVVPLSDGSLLHVPKSANLWVDVAAIHRNPAYWTRPDEFVPDRFIEGTEVHGADLHLRGGKGHTFFYFPFSAGEKNCIGHRFALMELQTILVHVLASVRFAVTPAAVLHPKRQLATITPVLLETTIHSV